MNPTEIAIVSTIATLISSSVAIIVTLIINNRATRKDLDDQLDTLIKISIEHPFLEDSGYTTNWVNLDGLNDDHTEYHRYENYCTLLFNFLARFCEFYDYNDTKIHKHLNVKSWIRTHRGAWEKPSIQYENTDSYHKKFRDLIDSYLK